jgi:anti-sigma B factor antagonist
MAEVTIPEPGVLALSGEIDLHASPQVKERLKTLIDQKLKRILVDLSAVTYIDSSGLALFIEAMQRIQGYGGMFGLYGLRPSVKTIFEIARLDQVFRIFADRSAAVAA